MPNPLVDAFNLINSLPINPSVAGSKLGQVMGNAVRNPQPQLPPQVQAAPQMPQLPQALLPQAPQPKAEQAQPGGNYDWLKLLIPAITAGVGVGVPGALPGAAGFQQGFSTEMTRQSENEGTKDFIVIDPETGKQDVFKVPKKAFVQQKASKGTDLSSLISEAFDIPETKTGDAVKEAKGKVRVINAEGKEFMLPSSQIEEAKKQGYKLAE